MKKIQITLDVFRILDTIRIYRFYKFIDSSIHISTDAFDNQEISIYKKDYSVLNISIDVLSVIIKLESTKFKLTIENGKYSICEYFYEYDLPGYLDYIDKNWESL